MRIRKRFHSLITPPDLSSPPNGATAAAAAAPLNGATGFKQGEGTAGGGGLRGSGGGSGGGGADAGGGGGRLHPNGDFPDDPFGGCTMKPTSLLRFHSPPPEAATAGGQVRGGRPPLPGPHLLDGDVLSDHSYGGQVPKREQDGENGGDGDADRRWNADAHSGAVVVASKSCLGAEVAELISLGREVHQTLPNGMPVEPGKAEDMGTWRDGRRGCTLKKRRGLYRARRGRRSSGVEEEEEDEQEINMVAEREMKPRPSNTRRKPTAASTSTRAMAATSGPGGAALTSTGGAGALTASGGANADRVMVKGEEEEADVVVAPADGSQGIGNGKKRRSPAVLMEGSRCSRVNGRGWRCCQQTLVGYSLCEHHLGKGRLRSVSSVRCNGGARKKEALDGSALSQQASPLQHRQQLLLSGDGGYEEDKPGKRRRKKMGMVKARSISSLLHQPDVHPTPTATASPEPCPSPSPAPATGTVIAASYTPAHDSNSASCVVA